MKRVWLILLAGIVALTPATTADGKAASKRIKAAASAGATQIKIGEKLSSYDLASKQRPVEIRVKGPVPLRVLSRFVFADPAGPETRSYRIRAEIDGIELRTAMENFAVSKTARTEAGGRIGTLETTTLRVPAGDHRIRLFPIEDGVTLALRVLKGTPAKAKVKWVSFQPEGYAEAARLQEKEVESTVYRMTQTYPVTLTVRGPMRMQVTTRLDFDHTNGVTQSYVIPVLLDGKAWKSFALKSRSSHTAIYPDFPEIVPGLGRSFEIAIPSGVHKVSIGLEATTARGASVRVRIPEKKITAP